MLSGQVPASPQGFIVQTRLIYKHNCKLASVTFQVTPRNVGKRHLITEAKHLQTLSEKVDV